MTSNNSITLVCPEACFLWKKSSQYGKLRDCWVWSLFCSTWYIWCYVIPTMFCNHHNSFIISVFEHYCGTKSFKLKLRCGLIDSFMRLLTVRTGLLIKHNFQTLNSSRVNLTLDSVISIFHINLFMLIGLQIN